MVKLVKPQIDVEKALEEALGDEEFTTCASKEGAALKAAVEKAEADTAVERLRTFLKDEKEAMDFVGRFQTLDWGDAEGPG